MATTAIKNKLPYAIEIDCNENATRHWRHPWCFDQNEGKLASRPAFLPATEPGTIASCFNEAAKLYAKDDCMGTRPIEKCKVEGKKIFWTKGPFVWKTFAEVHSDVQAASKGLLSLAGVTAKRQGGKCVAGILADTSAEWQMSAQAAFQVGIPITTVYTTLGHEAMIHGLNETECSVLFLDWTQYDVLLKPVLSKCKSLEHIVLIGKMLHAARNGGG